MEDIMHCPKQGYLKLADFNNFGKEVYKLLATTEKELKSATRF
jgi:hypothetical protein